MGVKKQLEHVFGDQKPPAFYIYRFQNDFWYRLWIKYLRMTNKQLITFFKFTAGFILFFIAIFTLLHTLDENIFNLKILLISFVALFVIFLIFYFIFIKERGTPVEIEFR